jgi:dTDP-4-amino-4,6-dideoxygalactose transaminase
MTFIATIEAVVAVGATPVVADVDPSTWNINLEIAAEKLSKKTKALIFVHLHGNPVGVTAAKEFCESNGIYLIEDAAQAHLAYIEEKFVGNFGDVAAFSFYPGKNLGALGEGGCLVTSDSAISEKAKLIRNWGSKQKYQHEVRGTNFRMDEIQGAILEVKLRKLMNWTQHRRILSGIYNEFFDELGIGRPFTQKGAGHSYHIYSIVVRNRDYLQKYLSENLIDTGIHYPSAVGQIQPWREYFRGSVDCNVSEDLAKSFLSLPLSDQHSSDDIKRVIEVIRSYFEMNKTTRYL